MPGSSHRCAQEDRRLDLHPRAVSVGQTRREVWHSSGRAVSTAPAPKPSAIDPRISEVTALMHRGMHRKLLLGELAGATGLSVSRLGHLFRNQIGLGPGQYLKLLRMHRAKDLIETSRLSVKEIAARLGYNDPSRFVEDFRRIYGQAPMRYRLRPW